MCNFCESDGWKKKTCNICGIGSRAYISISIEVPDGGDYPYTTTDLCLKCWREYGIEAAIEHNEGCRA